VASHVPSQPVAMLAPLPVQPLPAPARPAMSSVSASVPAVVELRPTPDTPGPAPSPAPAEPKAQQAAAIPTVGFAGAGPAAPSTEAPNQSAVTFRVFARLSNGERIEVGTHGDEAAAKAEATALMRFLRESGGDWPFLDGRFVRPEAIVSVDVTGS
jgi:hypothetical protein